MSENKIAQAHCAVQGCKFLPSNKIGLHPFPIAPEFSSKWLLILKNKCLAIDSARSKICSKHFEEKYFEAGTRQGSQRKLKENAIPTIFQSTTPLRKVTKPVDNMPKDKVDRLLNKLTQIELIDDIKGTMRLIKVPEDFSDCVTNSLQCVPDTPVEAQLWLLIKKQDHLITRMRQAIMQNKKHVEVLQKNIEESRAAKKEMEQSVESYKYIVKCLQEKHATLEEQIEILTSVESR